MLRTGVGRGDRDRAPRRVRHGRGSARLVAVGLSLTAFLAPPAPSQTVTQLSDLETSFASLPALDDTGTLAYTAASTNQLGGNPAHAFQVFSFDAVTGSGQQVSSFGAGVAPTTNATGLSSVLSVSDDGQWLAFVAPADPLGSNHDRSPELFVMKPDGTSLAQLTNDAAPNAGSVSQMELAGGGNRIVFVSTSDPLGLNAGGHEQLFAIERDGTGLAQLTSSAGGRFHGVAVSDDGTRIAFGHDGDLLPGGSPSNADLGIEVFAIQGDGTNLRQMTDDPAFDSRLPDVSGDGSTIVFDSNANLTSGNNQNQVEIFAVDWSGANLRKLTRTRPFQGADGFSQRPSVSDDGQTVVFFSNHSTNQLNPDGSFEIYKVQGDGTGLAVLSDAATTNGCFVPVISGDGSRVVFFSFADLVAGSNPDGSPELFAADSAGGSLVQLTAGTYGFNQQPDITPDGSRVVFAYDSDPLGDQDAFGGEIFVVNPDGSGLAQVTSLGTGVALTPSIAADGDLIAFASDGDPLGTNIDRDPDIFVIRSDGSSLVQLTFSAIRESAANPALAANGSQVYYDSDADELGSNADLSREVWRVLADGAGKTQITSGAAGTVSQRPRTDDAGTFVVFESNADLDGTNPDGTFEIFRADSDGANLASLTADGSMDSVAPDVSGDGARIVFASGADPLGTNPEGNFEVFLYEPATSSLTQVTATASGTSSEPRISGNGLFVTFLTDAPVFEADPDRPLHLARVELATGSVVRIGGLAGGRPTAAQPDGSGQRAVFSGSGDFTGGNPDAQEEVWVADRAADRGGPVPDGPAPTALSWTTWSGPLRYDVIRGDVAQLAAGAGATVDLGTVVCIENDSPDTSTAGDEDLADPPPGGAHFYALRGSDGLAVGPGSYGSGSSGAERTPSAGDCAP